MEEQTNNDAKQSEESSAPQDAKEAPATSTEAESPVSGEQEKGMESIVDSILEKHSQAPTEAKEEGEGQELAKSENEKEEPVPQSQKETPPGKEEEPPPFHEHPAWKRVVTQRDEARKELESAKPLLEKVGALLKFQQERGISDTQLEQALTVVDLLVNDPAKAATQLKGILAELEPIVGETIPSDLAEEVKEGTLTEERAKEIARLRAGQNLSKHQANRVAASQQQALVMQMTTDLNAWDESKRKTDPDFLSKSRLVRERFLSLYNATDGRGNAVNPVRSGSQAVALAERAYAEINDELKPFLPKPTSKKNLSSNGSSPTKRDGKPPANVREAVAQMLQKRHSISIADE